VNVIFGDVRYPLLLARNDRFTELHRFTINGAACLAPRRQREDIAPRHLAEHFGMWALAAKFDSIGQTELPDKALEFVPFCPCTNDATCDLGNVLADLTNCPD
jgi:hypothetical protein